MYDAHNYIIHVSVLYLVEQFGVLYNLFQYTPITETVQLYYMFVSVPSLYRIVKLSLNPYIVFKRYLCIMHSFKQIGGFFHMITFTLKHMGVFGVTLNG